MGHFLFLQEVVLFTRHFDLEAKVRKAVIENKLLLRERRFFYHALHSVNDFLTLKNVEKTAQIDNRF